MAGLVPAIHVLAAERKTWMPGTVGVVPGPAEGRTRVPGMTTMQILDKVN